MFSWISRTCILALLGFMHEAKAQCSYQPLSPNTIVSGTDVFCSSNEQSDVGNNICEFRAFNAISIRLDPSGTLNDYNELQFIDNGDGTLNVAIKLIQSYSPYVDNGGNDIPNAAVIDDTVLLCQDSDMTEYNSNLYVSITPENTQKPTFSDTSGLYSFINVPETLPPGIDFTVPFLGFGKEIIASDEDGSFGHSDHPQSTIVFEIEGGSEDFQVQSSQVSTTWPYTYRAAISLKRCLDGETNPEHTFVLIAINEDGDLLQRSTTNVTVTVGDSVCPATRTCKKFPPLINN